jgi:hypothetical protein
VTTVESAADALALLKDDPKAFDLVLTGAPHTPPTRNPNPGGAHAVFPRARGAPQ